MTKDACAPILECSLLCACTRHEAWLTGMRMVILVISMDQAMLVQYSGGWHLILHAHLQATSLGKACGMPCECRLAAERKLALPSSSRRSALSCLLLVLAWRSCVLSASMWGGRLQSHVATQLICKRGMPLRP